MVWISAVLNSARCVLQGYKIYTGSGNQGYEKYTPSSIRGMKTELVQISVVLKAVPLKKSI